MAISRLSLAWPDLCVTWKLHHLIYNFNNNIIIEVIFNSKMHWFLGFSQRKEHKLIGRQLQIVTFTCSATFGGQQLEMKADFIIMKAYYLLNTILGYVVWCNYNNENTAFVQWKHKLRKAGRRWFSLFSKSSIRFIDTFINMIHFELALRDCQCSTYLPSTLGQQNSYQ